MAARWQIFQDLDEGGHQGSPKATAYPGRKNRFALPTKLELPTLPTGTCVQILCCRAQHRGLRVDDRIDKCQCCSKLLEVLSKAPRINLSSSLPNPGHPMVHSFHPMSVYRWRWCSVFALEYQRDACYRTGPTVPWRKPLGSSRPHRWAFLHDEKNALSVNWSRRNETPGLETEAACLSLVNCLDKVNGLMPSSASANYPAEKHLSVGPIVEACCR